ncbi:transcriptional regulator with XRE-family HTH domain [Geomicrobium halophilum]|uniref:Transcriptional regulator with XRE-family HTH domain n=1 Tax=Geomicrobium halophilum TaxID=549000 RepID=A0A841PM45_9BACL|nr:helix-turn-helix transcriptional regulator [Geomicrobium halophilum]MBB6449830.1 transcriptional regulator with XRE-family HTH domain [Geomicrobium halophilum]
MKQRTLEQLREHYSLTQEQVALDVGIDRSYYSKIESGLTPSVSVAKRIGYFFDFDWTLFF